MERTPEMIAWAAGFFDGEGCVHLYCRMQGGYYKKATPRFYVSMDQLDRTPLDRIKELFGGSCVVTTRKKYNGEYRRYYHWRALGFNAYDFCRLILPYSTTKRTQLELAIKFCELPWRNSIKRGWKKGGTIRERVDAEVDVDVQLIELMSSLKNRKVPKNIVSADGEPINT